VSKNDVAWPAAQTLMLMLQLLQSRQRWSKYTAEV
jgi:hypothetical protein